MRNANLTRATVLYEGRVQGVGFRYTVVEEASGRDVSGTVRNLPDGRVELIAEGEPADVRAFLDAVDRGPLARTIRDRTVEWASAHGGFDGFTIRW